MATKQTRRSINVHPTQLARLEEHCKERGIPVSQAVSEMITSWVDKRLKSGALKRDPRYVVNTDFMIEAGSPAKAAAVANSLLKAAKEVEEHLVIGVDDDNTFYKER